MMSPKGRFSSSLIAIFSVFLFTFIVAISSCKQQSPYGAKIENTPPVSDTTSGYLSMSDWENAKAGQTTRAGATKKELDIFNKMAEDEWAKLRRMRL